MSTSNIPEKTLRALICDDSAFMRRMVRDLLDSTGLFATITEAGTADDALARYQEAKPHLVTMDIVMPGGKTGIDAVRNIVAADPKARIIMLSTMGQQELVVAALQAGARDYVFKPIQPGKFLDTITRLLRDVR